MKAKRSAPLKIIQVIYVVVILALLVLLLPILIPIFAIWIVWEKIATATLYFLLKSKSKSIVVYRGKDPRDKALIDEEIISNIHKDVMVFPDECSSKVLRFLIDTGVFGVDPSIFVIKGPFRKQLIPLKKTIAKFRKGSRTRLRNIIFNLNLAVANISELSNYTNVAEFKKDIIDELLTMAKSQENPEVEAYSISIEEYEVDFRYFKNEDLYVVWRFIESWCDETEHGFQGFYHGISQNEWPSMARAIAQSLESNLAIPEKIQNYFGLSRKSKK